MSRPKSHFLNLEQNLEGGMRESASISSESSYHSVDRIFACKSGVLVSRSLVTFEILKSATVRPKRRGITLPLSLGRRFVATDKTVVKRGTVVETSTIMKIL